MRFKKAQSILDYAIVFIAVAGLLLGIVRIWIWFNANYAKRQYSFQESRKTAALLSDTAKAKPYSDTDNSLAPVDIGYQPLDLTEDWVFKGSASGTVTGAPVGDASTGAATANCAENDSQCICLAEINPALKSYEEQAVAIDQQAAVVKKNSADLLKQAAECDGFFKCWFNGKKKSAKELEKAGNQLAENAQELYDSAKMIRGTITSMQGCCMNADTVKQSACLEALG
jgi:hypothetical protein